MITADMALAGVNSIIPFDEVVDAMYRVGRALPESLRETALGGIATTPTALGIVKQIYK
jgi:L-serine dehydratase